MRYILRIYIAIKNALENSAAEVWFSSVQTPLHPNQNQNRQFSSVQVQLHKLNQPKPVQVVQFTVQTRFGL